MAFTQLQYTKNQVLFPELDTLTGVDQTQTLQNQVGNLAVGTLTEAQLLALNSTPIELVPAPGAGYAIIVDEVQLKHNYAVAAYVGGGDLGVLYDGSTVVVLFADTFVTDASSASVVAKPTIYNLDNSTGTATGYDLVTEENLGIFVSNAAADFTGGDVANTIDYRVKYRVVGI